MDRRASAESEFKFIITEYILPLLPAKGNLRYRTFIPEKINKHIKYYSSNNVVDIYPCLETPQFHFRISVNAMPTKGAAEEILREIMSASQHIYSSPNFPERKYHDRNINGSFVYRKSRFDLAYEVGLSNWLGGLSVFRLLEKIHKWSQKTYEGKKMPFSFIIDATNNAQGTSDYIKFLDNKHSAVFTDGMSSGIALDNLGQIVKYFSTSDEPFALDEKRLPLVPYRFRDFANMCYSDKNGSIWIGIISQTNGDILIFKNKKIVFVKRNGKWIYIDSYKVFSTISEYLCVNTDVKRLYSKEVYLSILDVAFSHSGGCIAIVDEQHKQVVKDMYIFNDDLDRIDSDKKKILTRLIDACNGNENRSFFTLDRKLRQDLLSLDGATVIDGTGRIHGVGSIVKIDGGSEDGGRLAAARQLASYGLAVKVSTDGHIQGFEAEYFPV